MCVWMKFFACDIKLRHEKESHFKWYLMKSRWLANLTDRRMRKNTLESPLLSKPASSFGRVAAYHLRTQSGNSEVTCVYLLTFRSLFPSRHPRARSIPLCLFLLSASLFSKLDSASWSPFLILFSFLLHLSFFLISLALFRSPSLCLSFPLSPSLSFFLLTHSLFLFISLYLYFFIYLTLNIYLILPLSL